MPLKFLTVSHSSISNVILVGRSGSWWIGRKGFQFLDSFCVSSFARIYYPCPDTTTIAIQCYQSLPPAPTPQKLIGQPPAPPAPQKYPQHQPVNQLLSQNYHVIQGMLRLHPIGEINSSEYKWQKHYNTQLSTDVCVFSPIRKMKGLTSTVWWFLDTDFDWWWWRVNVTQYVIPAWPRRVINGH